MLTGIPISIAFAFLMWAHGMQLFDPKDIGTTVNRIVCSMCMAALIALHHLSYVDNIKQSLEIFGWSFAAILLWIWPGRMSEMTDAIGGDLGTTFLKSRIIGTLRLTLVEALIIPLFIGLAVITRDEFSALYSLCFLLMGLPYLFFGYALPGSKPNIRQFVILAPHAAVGFIIGAAACLAV